MLFFSFKVELPMGIIRIHKLKDRQQNDQKKKVQKEIKHTITY